MKKNISFGFAVFLILLYSAINIVLLLHHEPWEDEAHAWLVARDLDIISIFKQMAYDGTPALWYMLLVPFAKAGLPYISEFILHLVFAVAAVAIFVFYAPFSKVTKVLFIFSYYMAYEYSIIARSYGLSVFLIFLIAALYAKRFEYPLWYAFLIFLLFNTNAHSFSVASSLTILFAWEFYRNKVKAKRLKMASLIMCMGGLLSFLQVLPQPDTIDYRPFFGHAYPAPLIAIANAFFPWHIAFHLSGELRSIVIVISFLIFFTIILSFFKRPAVLFILLLSFSGLFYIFVFVYPGALRHHGFVLLILLFALWIGRYYPDLQKHHSNDISTMRISELSVPSMILINICLSLSLLHAFRIQYQEYKYTFSGAKEMAHFIIKNKLDNYAIVAHSSPYASALLPYLPERKFWYADIKNYGTFVYLNRNFLKDMNISNSEVISRMKAAFPNQSTILLLLSKSLSPPDSNGFKLLYKVDNVFGYNREKYYLYKPVQEEP
ncbi:MAG: hypothetical protein A2Y97_13305 [Nitrospirae bacterium RBG_13_39_12]|nr:MAG: hypothetical protein A2Y97_13305 [Nitrospirae bacterium RBG_13_39_12]